MKNDTSKGARHLALLNAAAMIEQHGDEGGIDEDELGYPEKIYRRECKAIAKRLEAEADRYRIKWNLTFTPATQ